NEVLSYEEEMNFSVFNCTEEDSIGKPLYNRFIKTSNFKGVPHPLSGDYTPTPQEEIDESLYVYGKKGPQEPEPSVLDDRSSKYSTCQSNDSVRSIGTSSEHFVDPESEISRVPQEVYVSNPITTNEKGVSASKSKEIYFLPTTFWAEKQLYLLATFLIGYYLVVLGKFDGRSDEEILGWLLTHSKPIGFIILMDVDNDYLTDSMNYIPVSLENQANPHAGTSEGQVPENKLYQYSLQLILCSQTVNTGGLILMILPMPGSINLSQCLETGIFDEASYDEEGLITDFNNDVGFKAIAVDELSTVQATTSMGSCRSTSWNEDGYGSIDEEVYVSLPLVFVVPDHPKMDKYVAEILEKFDLVNMKAAITPMETKVALKKDEEAIDIDVHLYRSMIVPQLISRIDSLETDLKQTKLIMGNAIVKLVKKVKKLEGILKRRNVVLSDSEEEELEA
ncbi:hypothetical protein Tco_0785177, partial [Tanacetum coccineum]